MPNHVKPTTEELEENIKNIAEELETEKPEEEEVPEVEEKEEEVEEETEAEVEIEEEPEEEVAPSPDYKEKFIASTKEAQILHAKNKKVNEALDKAMSSDEATKEELMAEYPEYEDMSDFEQKMAKDSYTNKKRLAALSEITKETKDVELWNSKVDAFVDDPNTLVDNPKLEGKTNEFKLFANKPTRRGVDMEDLVSAFLYSLDETAKPKSKGKMFETGTGGSKEKNKPTGKLSVEEGRILREKDYKKYTQYLKEDKIDKAEF